ncbi:hypothetical protein QFZ47_001744 [Variovorax paradoxus]|nr:hypothetical protein [Variovorax paradoxus]
MLFFGRRRGGNAQRRVTRHGFGLRGEHGFGFWHVDSDSAIGIGSGIGDGLGRFRRLGRCRLVRRVGGRAVHHFRRSTTERQFALRFGLRRQLHRRLFLLQFRRRFHHRHFDGPQVQQRAREQIQFAADRQPHGPRRIDDRRDGGGRQPRRAVHGADRRALDQRGRERPSDERRAGPLRAQRRKQRRRFARVGHRDDRAVARAPARHRQPGRTEAEDQDGEVFQMPHVLLLFLLTAASASKGPRGTAAS